MIVSTLSNKFRVGKTQCLTTRVTFKEIKTRNRKRLRAVHQIGHRNSTATQLMTNSSMQEHPGIDVLILL